MKKIDAKERLFLIYLSRIKTLKKEYVIINFMEGEKQDGIFKKIS